MQMDAGLDTGALISARAVSIGPRDSAATLTERLAAVGAEAIVDTLNRLQRDGRVEALPQHEEGASYARKISRDDAAIDWQASALAIDRQVRALDPVPGAFTVLGGKPIKIWSSEPAAGHFGRRAPSSVRTAGASSIACGEGRSRCANCSVPAPDALNAAGFLVRQPDRGRNRVGTTSLN